MVMGPPQTQILTTIVLPDLLEEEQELMTWTLLVNRR